MRWIMAGPLTLITAILSMASAPLWMPAGAAGIDNLVFPILLFPAFWAACFFYALMEARPVRGTIVMLAVALANAVILYGQF